MRIRGTTLTFILILICVSSIQAQLSGDWEMVESPHFQVYYQPDVTSPQEIVNIAEDFYPRLHRLIDGTLTDKIEIWVCKTHAQFQAAVHAPIQDWAVGCAFPLTGRIVLQNPRVILEREFQLAQVLRHEIVHVVFGQRVQKAIRKIPLWFNEGIAIYLSREWVPRRRDVLLKHVLSGSVIPLAELTDAFPKSEHLAQLAYAESGNAVAWFVEIAGEEKLWEVIGRLADGSDFADAFQRTTGRDLEAFDAQWRDSLPQRYHWAAIFSSTYLFWGTLGLLFILIFLRCWRRTRQRLNELAIEESEVDPFFSEDSTEK